MLIGLTYDLRSEYLSMGYSDEETAEFDHENTIAAIETALHQLGYETERIGHLRTLVGRLAAGAVWDLVFNIAEGMFGLAREAQVPALLDAWRIPYTFSDTLVLALCMHKGLTKRVVRDVGVPAARHLLVSDLDDLGSLDFPPPYFAKPVAEGTGKGVDPSSIVRDPVRLRQLCGELLERYQQPVLLEEFLPGREFTVGITGTGRDSRILGVLEVILLQNAERQVYSYNNKENWKNAVEYRFCNPRHDATAAAAGKYALDAYQVLGCRDAGRIDLRCDEGGVPNFIEINPLAGLRPEYSDLPILAEKAGVPYLELIRRIMDSARERICLS